MPCRFKLTILCLVAVITLWMAGCSPGKPEEIKDMLWLHGAWNLQFSEPETETRKTVEYSSKLFFQKTGIYDMTMEDQNSGLKEVTGNYHLNDGAIILEYSDSTGDYFLKLRVSTDKAMLFLDNGAIFVKAES